MLRRRNSINVAPGGAYMDDPDLSSNSEQTDVEVPHQVPLRQQQPSRNASKPPLARQATFADARSADKAAAKARSHSKPRKVEKSKDKKSKSSSSSSKRDPTNTNDLDDTATTEDKQQTNDKDTAGACSLCDGACRKPKVLQCLHTFCTGCLEVHSACSKAKRGQLVCPDCDQAKQVPSNGATVDLDMGPVMCDVCGSLPDVYCKECGFFLCGSHLAAHGRMKATKAHKPVVTHALAPGELETIISQRVFASLDIQLKDEKV